MWTSAPTTTWTAGAPMRPSSSTSQPARRRTAWRAAAMATKCAMVAPVVKPTDDPVGSPSRSMSHSPVISSTTDAAGVPRKRPTFCSHAEVSQSAASAAGTDPPMTNPK